MELPCPSSGVLGVAIGDHGSASPVDFCGAFHRWVLPLWSGLSVHKGFLCLVIFSRAPCVGVCVEMGGVYSNLYKRCVRCHHLILGD